MVGQEDVGRALEDSQLLPKMPPAIVKERQKCLGISLSPPSNLPPVPVTGQTQQEPRRCYLQGSASWDVEHSTGRTRKECQQTGLGFAT